MRITLLIVCRNEVGKIGTYILLDGLVKNLTLPGLCRLTRFQFIPSGTGGPHYQLVDVST